MCLALSWHVSRVCVAGVCSCSVVGVCERLRHVFLHVCFYLWLVPFSCVHVCVHTSAPVYPRVHFPSMDSHPPGPLCLSLRRKAQPPAVPRERWAVLPSSALPSAWPPPASALSLPDPLVTLCPRLLPPSSACSPEGAWLCFLAPVCAALSLSSLQGPSLAALSQPRAVLGSVAAPGQPLVSLPGSPPGIPWPRTFRCSLSFFLFFFLTAWHVES